MTPEFWAIIAVGTGVFVSHLSLHRDIAGLRERMARIEGRVDSLAGTVSALVEVLVSQPERVNGNGRTQQ